jgi:hypothetical protein
LKVAFALLALGALGCLSPRADTEVLTHRDFSSYATYAQGPGRGASDARPEDRALRAEVGARVEAEIDRELRAKGYRPVPRPDADLWVSFRVHGESRAAVTAAGDPDASYQVIEGQIEETLVIKVFEAQSGERIWQGQSRAQLRHRRDLGDGAAAEVRSILAQFPPQH